MLSELLTHFFRAFLVGGAVCLVGQLLFDAARLTPAHTMSILVCSGSVLGVLGLWPALTDFAGYGAALPIVNFGSMLTEGALRGGEGRLHRPVHRHVQDGICRHDGGGGGGLPGGPALPAQGLNPPSSFFQPGRL